MSRISRRAGSVGFLLAACAACCAGPLLFALGLGFAAVIGLILGAVAVAVALLSLVTVLGARLRSNRRRPAGLAPVALSRRR